MGAKMAPTYATLTLAHFEENQYEIIGKKYDIDKKEEFTIHGKILGWLLHILEMPIERL